MNEQEDTNARTEKELAELQTLSAGKIREHIAELNESETVYRFMFENNPLPMYVVDFATLQFLFVNEAAIALYGYSKEEFFAMTVADIRLPDEVENLQNEAKSISKTYYYGDARRHKKKNGDIIWVEIATMGFLYNGKKSAIVLINDVTKRKLDEEILRDSEAQFRKLTELSPEGIMILDDEGFIHFANPAMLHLFQTERGEKIIGKNIFQMIATRGLDDCMECFSKLMNGHTDTWKTETVFIAMNGVEFDAEVVAGMFQFAGTNAVQMLVRDISERKTANVALSKSEERYRTLFEESKDVIFICTADGHFIDINQAGIELFGYASKEEINHLHIGNDIYVDAHVRESNNRLLNEQGFVKDFEIAIRRKNGEVRIVLETSTVVKDDIGNVIGYRGILRDITAQKNLEAQLLHAQKMESIGTLAGGIAHDFNNILAIITGYTSLLQMQKDTIVRDENAAVQLNKALGAITVASERAAHLVGQILTFARKTSVEFTYVNVNSVIEDIVELLRTTFAKILTVVFKPGYSVPLIRADETQIHQTLMNLCVNARDAMPDGGTLSIYTKTVEGIYLKKRFPKATEQMYVHIIVSDTGIGMDDETIARVFEPFFTTKDKGKGTGLGLSVVFGIVESHNGFIEVESVRGRGTAFMLYFPSAGEQIVLVPQEHTLVTKEKHINKNGNQTILVVEDEEMLADMITTLLKKEGYTVINAYDGWEAIEQLRTYKDEIGIVLSDLGLPKLGGWEAYLKMRQIKPDLPVLIASGFLEPQLRAEMKNFSSAKFLQKPYDAAEVMKILRTMLR